MKLYDVPRRTHVQVTGVRTKGEEHDLIVFFERVDGMYSLCKTEDGETFHPAAWTEVEVVHGFKG